MICPTCGIEVPSRYCPKCRRDCQESLSHQARSSLLEKVPTEADPAKQRLAAVSGFSEFIGQQNCVSRLKAFGDLYASQGATPEHILLTGDDGLGKLRLARAFAKAYSAALHESSAESFKRRGDFTAEVTSLDSGNAFIVENINTLRQPVLDVFRAALQKFQIDLIIGLGPAARVHPYRLNQFTCIATAPSRSDLQPDLLKCFSLSLQLQPYRASELESIANLLSKENDLVLSEGVSRLIAGVSEGNPSRIEQFVKRFSRLGKKTVTAEDAAQVLAAFGLDPFAVTSTANPAILGDLNSMTGVEFEQLITNLLRRMGFQADMTRATGDGGIDIVAHLTTPLVGGRYLIQCKRFADAQVGAAMVREFYGALVADRKAIKGIFITTSGFTEQASDFAQDLPIELIDGVRLRQMLGHGT